jgi:hypothetical protein
MYEMNSAGQRFLILWILCLLIGYTVKLVLDQMADEVSWMPTPRRGICLRVFIFALGF